MLEAIPKDGDRFSKFTEAQRAAIAEELGRLFTSRYFSHSHRLPSFMQFVVDTTLAGRDADLKERTIGVEIFHRKPDYDTSSDPIVRVTAAEIRKRLAQYYEERDGQAELHISLPSGSYIPHFRFLTAGVGSSVRSIDDRPREPPIEEPEPAGVSHAWWRWAGGLILAAIICSAAVWGWRSAHPSPSDFFWGPALRAHGPIVFCVADQQSYPDITLYDATNLSQQFVLKQTVSAVVSSDLDPIVRIARVLESSRKQYKLIGATAARFQDLRAGPTVFIGAFDNVWTLRVTRSLRYHFFNNADWTEAGIADGKSADGKSADGKSADGKSADRSRWSVKPGQQMANSYRDYAIVARFADATTGNIAVVAAGVGQGGTIAAGQFLTNPDDLAELMRRAKAAGNKRNMEAVISSEVIGGEPGAPTVEAAYFW